jgi:Putative transposase, YhgA-like
MKKQGSLFDKILKENIDSIIPAILSKILDIQIVKSEMLSGDIQRTKELKTDVLQKITDNKNRTFILHLEFQANDDNEMVYRMQEYYGMLKRKYKLPIRQFVVYLGTGSF